MHHSARSLQALSLRLVLQDSVRDGYAWTALQPIAPVLFDDQREVTMMAGAYTADNSGYRPYYGPSQGYAYPSGRGYYAPPPNYYPARYGYGSHYAGYNSGPSITFTFPQGTVP